MDPILQLMTAVVSTTASFALVFGGLAGWFVRRLDRRFDTIDAALRHHRRGAVDTIDGRFDAAAQETRQQHAELKTDLQRQIGELRDDTQKQFDEARVDRGSLKTDLQGQIRELKADMRSQFDIAREERNRLAIRIDHVGERVEGFGDQLANVRQSLGQLEGAMFAASEPERQRGQKTA